MISGRYAAAQAKRLERWQEADNYEFLMLADELIPRGLRYLKTAGWRHHDAEDMAYLALYDSSVGYNSHLGSPQYYYFRRLQFNALNKWRADQRYDRVKKHYSGLVPQYSETHHQASLKHDIEWLLSNIPEVLSETMTGVYLLGYTFREMGKNERCSDSMINLRVQRAKPLLREAWKEEMHRWSNE